MNEPKRGRPRKNPETGEPVAEVPPHPTIAHDADGDSHYAMNSSGFLADTENYSPSAPNAISHGYGEPNQESPTDWQSIQSAPKDKNILLSRSKEEDGIPAQWRRTRIFNHGWKDSGWWVDPVTKQRVVFEAKYWKPL